MDHLEHVALRSLRIKGSSCAFLPVVFPVAEAGRAHHSAEKRRFWDTLCLPGES